MCFSNILTGTVLSVESFIDVLFSLSVAGNNVKIITTDESITEL